MTSEPNPVNDYLQSLDGARIPGGCDHCDAYQDIKTVTGGVFMVNVHHDDWCPFYSSLPKGKRP